MAHSIEDKLETPVLTAWPRWATYRQLQPYKRLGNGRLIDESNSASEDGSPGHRPLSLTSTLLLTTVAILVATRLALAPNVAGLLSHPVPGRPTAILHDCGHNSTEAQAKGCIFDLLSLQWTPRACYNRTLAAQPLRADDELAAALGGTGNFSFYSNDGLHTVLALPLQGPATVRTTLRFHRAHCSYLWRLALAGIERASSEESDVQVLEIAARWRHSLHCNMIMLDRRGYLDEEELFYVGLGRCVNISPTGG